MIFVTIGTMYPFDRLIKTVDEAVERGLIREDVFAQIGCSKYRPKYIRYIQMIDREAFLGYVKKSSAIIAHAGIGTIILARDYNKPLLVMPRMKRYKEHVNDHQLDTAETFAKLGYLLVAHSSEELIDQVGKLRELTHKKRNTGEKAMIKEISRFLQDINMD